MAEISSTAFIRTENLCKHYELGGVTVRALDGVNLSIRTGEFVAIMGPSGSGKSTMLNLIGGLDRPTGGRIWVGNEDITALDQDALCAYRRRRVGFVFQTFNLLGTMTALENVAFPMIFSGVPADERRERAKDTLEAIGLERRFDHRPTELSGGEQQRVAMARALVNNPDILLADEPTGNLDSHTGAGVMRLLRDVGSQGRTVIVATHDEQVAKYADHVYDLLDGVLVLPRVKEL